MAPPGRKGRRKSWKGLARFTVGMISGSKPRLVRLPRTPTLPRAPQGSPAPPQQAQLPGPSDETKTTEGTRVRAFNQHELISHGQILSKISDRVDSSQETSGQIRYGVLGLPGAGASSSAALSSHGWQGARSRHAACVNTIAPALANLTEMQAWSTADLYGWVSQPCTEMLLMTVEPCAERTSSLRAARRVYSALLLAEVTSTMKYSSRYHHSKRDDKSKGFFWRQL